MNINMTNIGSISFIALIALTPLFLLLNGCGEDKPTTIEETIRISDVTVSVTGDNALIRWKTDIPADSLVEYGLTKSYRLSSGDATDKTQHTIKLTGLELQSTYYFRVTSTDELRKTAQSSRFTFATLTEGEKGPKASEVKAATEIETATITFIANESAKVEVEYGEDTSYGLVAKSGDIRTKHSVLLTNLKPETTYHYRIKVIDLDGNVVTSDDFTFETKAEPKESISTFNITARQWDFSPATIRVTEGDKVILNIRSVDVAHGFGLSAFRVNEALNPNQEVTVEFTAKKKGEYTFTCTVQCGAGHPNMTGKLIVEKE